MLQIKESPVSQHTLEQLFHELTWFGWVFCIGLFIITCFFIGILIIEIVKFFNKKGKMSSFIFICLINIIIIPITITNLLLPSIIQHKYLSNDKLKEYTINGECVVNNIENGSDTDRQELRIDDGKKNYYITLPSKIPVSSGDKINIHNQKIVQNKYDNHHNFSENIKGQSIKVTINHNHQKIQAKTKALDTGDIMYALFIKEKEKG